MARARSGGDPPLMRHRRAAELDGDPQEGLGQRGMLRHDVCFKVVMDGGLGRAWGGVRAAEPGRKLCWAQCYLGP